MSITLARNMPSIVLATLKSKDPKHPDVDVSCHDYGGPLWLEQGGNLVELDNAQVQQLTLVIEREMAQR